VAMALPGQETLHVERLMAAASTRSIPAEPRLVSAKP
jgi:hypothetical protein